MVVQLPDRSFGGLFLFLRGVFYEVDQIRIRHIVRTLPYSFNQMLSGEFDIASPARRGNNDFKRNVRK
ncbi:MAG: hypothetical protein KH347_03985 [Acetobacter sp.]|nr:hypothetical protein [Acetobacter sp.]